MATYERNADTLVNAAPGGDTVRTAIVDRLNEGINDLYTVANAIDAEIAGFVAATDLADTGGAALVGYGSETVDDALAARPTSATLAASGGSALVGFLQDGTGAVARTVQGKLRDVVSLSDFATGDGTTDDSAKVLEAIAAANGKPLYVTDGKTFRIDTLGNTALTLPVYFYGGGTLDGGSQTTSGFVFWGDISSIEFRGVKFRNIAAPVVKASANTDTISKLTFVDCDVEDCQKGVYLNCEVKKAIVVNNRFRNLDHSLDLAAVHLGNGLYASQDAMGEYIVEGNIIDDVVSSGTSQEAHGVICYGKEAVVSGNIIKGVSNANGANCEAIYTKCRFANIEGNVITGCGGLSANQSANIAVKGSTRSSTTSPQGFGVTVRGNMLYAPTTGGVAGIRIEQEDVLVEGNYLEGFGGYGIYTPSGTFDDVTVRDNTFREHRGVYCIFTQHIGRGLRIRENNIHNLKASEGAIADAIGIGVTNASGTINDVDITDNTIIDDGSCAATTRIKGIRITNNSTRIINRLRISRNKIAIAHASLSEFGIDLSNSGSVVDFECKDNDLSGVPTTGGYPVFDQGAFSGFSGKLDISGNTGWGPIYDLNPSSIEAHHCGVTFTNTGATGIRTSVLPVAQVGLWYTFIRTNATYAMRVDPDGADTIRGGGAGKYLELDTVGDSVTLRCFEANKWEIVAGYGAYAFES